jgi:TonB family protein
VFRVGAATLIVILLVRPARPALAQSRSGRDPAGVSEGEPDATTTAPVLQTHVEATYPAEALRDHIEGSVSLQLDVDENGEVTDARVLAPAGHGFDEAAVAAARQFKFTPAMRAGKPLRSVVQLSYEFHLPPLSASLPSPSPTPAPALTPAPTPVQQGPDQSTLVLAHRPTSAASSVAVEDRDFQLRPIGSVQDILRVTPGLVMVQHSGGGKASQYFLRGFDADHGTDLALSIDGVPINLPSHAHGQGFADTNFIIPEAVQRVDITKGPYFANQSDFATAGAVNLVTRDAFDHSSVGFGLVGSPGHGEPGYRGLLIASAPFPGRWDAAAATFAADVGRQNGPFDNPDKWDKYRLFGKFTVKLASASTLSIGEMSYGGTWSGSGQIPARAVEQGYISRFGSVDPSEGGDTMRHQVYAQYWFRHNEESELRASTFLGTYTFNLFSNFTLFLVDPDNGDEIDQQDRRTFYGAKLSYRILQRLGPVRFETTVGSDVREDDIHESLAHTRARVQLSALRDNSVREMLIGAYLNEEIMPLEWVRVVLGGRADQLAFSVDNHMPTSADPANPHSGVDGVYQLSPKASAIVSALRRKDALLDLFVNWGNGFHSNDVRGVFASPSVTPLTRAIGEEIGARTHLFDRLDLAAVGWMLDLDSETLWDGDSGTTVPGPPTRRYGVELDGRFQPLPWLVVDGAVTFTHSQFSADAENGGGLALAPKQTWSGGLAVRRELGPGLAGAGLRFYGIGDRPASADGVIVASGFTQVDLHLGYRMRRWDLTVDIENLLNESYRAAQFDTVSRLRTEPAVGTPLNQVPSGLCGNNGRLVVDAATGGFGGCEGIDFTPAYPLTVRATATLFLD